MPGVGKRGSGSFFKAAVFAAARAAAVFAAARAAAVFAAARAGGAFGGLPRPGLVFAGPWGGAVALFWMTGDLFLSEGDLQNTMQTRRNAVRSCSYIRQ